VGAEERLPQRWSELSELIATRTGLHFPPERRDDLRRALDEAAPEFGCQDGEACAEWLLSRSISSSELRTLATHLTIGETYFFRERPAFNALATHVLPVLIHRNRATTRRLRLWSAACSSGEEAYSLAILLQQILPDWRDWNLSILATDINPGFLRKAEAGVYGEWSFRDSQPDFRARWFTRVGANAWQIRPESREMVTFTELNLAQDSYPSLDSDTNAMDLVLCRNVLIYFTPEHARRLVAGMHKSLVDDGWLIVSPSECSQTLFREFTAMNFPGSIVYRKKAHREVRATAPAALEFAPLFPMRALTDYELAAALTAPEAPPDDLETGIAAVQLAFDAGDYAAALRAGAALAARSGPPADSRLLSLEARALANQGKLADALAASERWIATDKVDPAAHYLNAMVLQELGERARCRAALQRAVYLLPEFALAHFALGNNARAEARAAEARRHFENAARLLRGRPADDLVPESEGLTVGRMREIITALLADGASA
jgi:chemotaxis protein methyltransferase CheR